MKIELDEEIVNRLTNIIGDEETVEERVNSLLRSWLNSTHLKEEREKG